MNISPDEEKRYEQLQVMALDFARHGETQELTKMIQAGLSVNLSDPKGQSLIMLASYNGQYETTKALIDLGAFVDQKNDRGQTPLAGVCFKGYFEIVQLLVEHGADINSDNGLGATPISFARMFGHVKIVEYLLSKNAKKPGLGSKVMSLFAPFIKKMIAKKAKK